MVKKSRGIIVSIYAIFQMLVGLLFILSGLFLLVIGGVIIADIVNNTPELAPLATFITLIWAVILIAGLIVFLIGYGLWKLNFIAWLITTILLGLSTLSYLLNYETLLQGSILTPIIQFLLLIYFVKVSDKFR